VTESRGQKNDTRDAYGLAEKLRTGALGKRIFKAPREFSVLRELSRMHLTVVRDVVRVQSRLKSLYPTFRIRRAGFLPPLPARAASAAPSAGAALA
jgi:hypothetical protein